MKRTKTNYSLKNSSLPCAALILGENLEVQPKIWSRLETLTELNCTSRNPVQSALLLLKYLILEG